MSDQAGYLERMRIGERLEAMLRDLSSEQPAEVSSWLQRWVAGSWNSAATGRPPAAVQAAALGREPGSYLRFVAQFAGSGEADHHLANVSPRGAAPGADVGEWKAHVAPPGHARAGRTFYVNKGTNEKRWDPPPGFPADPATHEPPPTQPAAIPRASDWEAVRASNGRVFWYDKNTKQKTWERPEGAPEGPPQPVASAPSDWKMFVSDKPGKEGQKWWYNTRTKEKSWERPPGVPEEDELSAPAPPPQAPVADYPAAPAHPAPAAPAEQEWTQHTTAGGKVFYYNTITKAKSWDKPAGFVPPPSRDTNPDDWTVHTTEKQGKVVHWWHNRQTGEKSWSKPDGVPDPTEAEHSRQFRPDEPPAAPAAPAPLPAAPAAPAGGPSVWTVHRAGADKFFWYNKETKEKTWSRPEGGPPPPEAMGTQDDWEQVKAQDGREFWYNRETREKSWVKPF
eukprot:Hpha_TRINITY_DN16355_c0_g4::TRINITY_DN16355_c0_g4_i1::g.59290::m.59290